MSKIENTNASSPFLRVRNLTVEYTADGEVIHAVNNVSFELKKGSTLGLVGETGAGKTTIAKAILRILPEFSAHIRSGSIELEGEDLLHIDEGKMQEIRGNRISMIFQDPMTALNPVMSVGKQIAEVIKLHDRAGKAEANEKAMKMLEMVGITRERFYEYPHQFSGGMKQRVIIAMALACTPELLLADEPTTALDVTIQAQVLEMIAKLRDELNTAMVLITHDFGIVAEMCDYVAVVYAGRIIEQGSREDIFDSPTHPYTIGLFNSIPKIDDEEKDMLDSIPGLPPNPADLPVGCSFWPRCPRATEQCRSDQPVPEVELSQGHLCLCWNTGKVV